MDLLLKGGLVVLEERTVLADILISKGVIQSIQSNLQPEIDTYVIDCKNKFSLPGVIDAHVHFNMPCGKNERTIDDFYNGSVSAACGGVTTVIDYVEPLDDQPPQIAVNNRLAEANDICIDYALHYVVRQWDERFLEELESVIKSGINSLKVFTAYKDMMLSYDEIYQLLKWSKEKQVLVTFHAEDEDIIQTTKDKFLRDGKILTKFHGMSRPIDAEVEAVKRIIAISSKLDAEVYFVHVSSYEAAKEILHAREQGYKVLAETCPHYLFLNSNMYLTHDYPELFIMCPPLREDSQRSNLCQLIKEDVFSVIATDHCAFTKKQKLVSRELFQTLSGIPGVETLLSLMFNLVASGEININKLSNLLSTNPAKIYGLYPRKGVIKEGSDADIVIFNPNKKRVLRATDLHSKAKYTPFEGISVQGYPETTILRGEIIYNNEIFLGNKGYGEFIPGAKHSKC